MIKDLPTLGVVGVFTGRLLKQEDGMAEIHQVMDHLYPGIMTLGIAAMQPAAAKYLGDHVPKLRELPACTRGNHADVARVALERFGETIRVEGPIKDINPLSIELAAMEARGK